MTARLLRPPVYGIAEPPRDVYVRMSGDPRWPYKTTLDVIIEVPRGILAPMPDVPRPINVTETRGHVAILSGREEVDRVLVTKSYAYDGASVPRSLRWIGGHNRSLRPALRHDVLYQLNRLGLVTKGSRAAVDRVFRRDLLAAGMDTGLAWAYWAGVRVGGWKAWRVDNRGRKR
jgi:hypothetical protein